MCWWSRRTGCNAESLTRTAETNRAAHYADPLLRRQSRALRALLHKQVAQCDTAIATQLAADEAMQGPRRTPPTSPRHRPRGGYHGSKELKHFPKGFPEDQWIGMKFICRTRGQSVKLEQHENTTDGANGGRWAKVAEMIDNGLWAEKPHLAAQPSTFIRNDGLGEARCKKWAIREIAPLGQ